MLSGYSYSPESAQPLDLLPHCFQLGALLAKSCSPVVDEFEGDCALLGALLRGRPRRRVIVLSAMESSQYDALDSSLRQRVAKSRSRRGCVLRLRHRVRPCS